MVVEAAKATPFSDAEMEAMRLLNAGYDAGLGARPGSLLDGPSGASPDDLKRIRGVSPRLETALNELGDWGRPRRILLCVLVDRGGRELPIQPDITGRWVHLTDRQRVDVLVPELDGRLGVDLLEVEPEAA